MRLVHLSDTHGYEVSVPDGDVVVHSGDFCSYGDLREVRKFNGWFGALPHPHKILVAGNHDRAFQLDPTFARATLSHSVIYLQDTSVEIEGVSFYGSPWTPAFGNWAFMAREDQLHDVWKRIPRNTQVLVTHGPPFGIRDMTRRGVNAGCPALSARLWSELPRLRLHLFGHIHEGYGTTELNGVTFSNGAVCTEAYEPVNVPVVFDL